MPSGAVSIASVLVFAVFCGGARASIAAQTTKPQSAGKPQSSAKPSTGSSSSKPAPKPTPVAIPPNQLGIVDGIPILQEEWDRLAGPYFEEVAARAGRALTDEERRLLQRNVLDELIRERLWVADALRRGMKPTEAAVDARMKQSAYFKTGGKVDDAKFLAFKRSPTSNYPALRAQVERGLELEEYVRWMERRFGPREGELKKTFEERTTLGSIRFGVVGPDAVSLEPEATAEQIRAYYDAHPDEFETADEAHVQYIRIRAAEDAAASDSAKAASAAAAKEASEILTAVRAGTPPETAGKAHGGVLDSGWFRIGDPVRGLGRSDALEAAVRATAAGEWVAEPVRVGPFLVLVRVAERRAARRQPFQEVVVQAKRKADTQVREAWLDSLARAEIAGRPGDYSVPRVECSLVARALASFSSGKPPSNKEVAKAVEQSRKRAGIAKSEQAWIDSATAATPARLTEERRLEAASRLMRDAAKHLREGAAATTVAGGISGTGYEFARYKGEPPAAPILAEGTLLDSLYTLRPGAVVGPTSRGDSIFVVRVDRLDPAYRPPYEAVRAEARTAALDARRARQEREAETWFADHRSDYMTQVKWVLDYVRFTKPNPATLGVPEDSIAAYWKEHPAEFTVPGRARVRQVLAANKGPEAGARDAARQKALAARKRILAGEEFAVVAREMSDDPGSASKGGDIGEITRGTVLKEFGELAFTLPIGETSEPFESRLGFHVIQVLDRTADRVRTLDDCRQEIQEVLGGAEAESLAKSAALAFAAPASRSGASFDSLAAGRGGARRSPPISAGDELEGIGRVPDLARVMGGLGDGAVAAEPVAISDGFLVLRRVREIPPEPAPYAQVRERVVSDYLASKRRAIADSLDLRFRAALRADQDLETLFIPLGGLRQSRQFGRSGPIPDLARDPGLARDSTYLAGVFAGKAGAVLPPLAGRMGTLYAKIDTVIVLPPSEFAKGRDALLRELIDERVEAWTARLRAKAPIRLHRRDLQALLTINPAVAPPRERP